MGLRKNMSARNKAFLVWFVLIALCIVTIMFLRKRFERDSAKKENTVEIPVDPSLVRHPRKNPRPVKPDTDSVLVQNCIPIEWPYCKASQVIRYRGYDLCYDENSEQALWVAYQLTESETIRRYERTNKFIEDPHIKTRSAGERDYKGSGYDRGHLAPAADMGWSSQTMAESFYYSNMSPQVPAFNRGIWKRLEEQVRDWAVELDTIYVVTGPVLKGKMTRIGPEEVAVPNYYYKAILTLNGKDAKAIGFIMANQSGRGSLYQYAVSIDSLEKFTGLNFFASLPDVTESRIETQNCIPCWAWNNKRSAGKSSAGVSSESVQCSGTTKAGKRCRRMTKDPTGRCYQHNR